MQLKAASQMTEAEVRRAVEQLDTRRAERLAYRRATAARMTPEQKDKQPAQRAASAQGKGERESEVMALQSRDRARPRPGELGE